MLRKCEPLFEGDDNNGRGHCGRMYDDEFRWTICPHRPLDEEPTQEHDDGS